MLTHTHLWHERILAGLLTQIHHLNHAREEENRKNYPLEKVRADAQTGLVARSNLPVPSPRDWLDWLSSSAIAAPSTLPHPPASFGPVLLPHFHTSTLPHFHTCAPVHVYTCTQLHSCRLPYAMSADVATESMLRGCQFTEACEEICIGKGSSREPCGLMID
ncbi:unnamed protein product [Protopolystoma xenopodis]|uniref:Uncharacterized protein n=1 Tax=Protopolystoma xenopodis TaxID=117903 RepID=A0A3S5B2Z2_9PLAT|nr:unnamed protein product [Protopolystoma xenopodis]